MLRRLKALLVDRRQINQREIPRLSFDAKWIALFFYLGLVTIFQEETYLGHPTSLHNDASSSALPPTTTNLSLKKSSNKDINIDPKSSSWERTVVEKRWKPIDCPSFLQQFMSSNQDPNKSRLYARYIESTQNPFWISLHNHSVDIPRWSVFDHGKYYETALTQIFQDILRQDDNETDPAIASTTVPRVVDVGGNVGWFTLLSASMNHHVDVFEPLPINQARICQSMALNGWTTATEDEILHLHRQQQQGSINIRPYAISDLESDAITMYHSTRNPGMATFEHTATRKHVAVSDIPIRTLDQMAQELGWLTKKPSRQDSTVPTMRTTIAILKIDIEGNEIGAVHGATHLLQSGLVQNIMLEVTGKANNDPVVAMLESIVEAGYDLYQWGLWIGPDKPAPAHLHTIPATEQAQYIVEKKLSKVGKQVNLWYKRKKKTSIPTSK